MNKLKIFLISYAVFYLAVAELEIWGHVNHWWSPFWDINGQVFLGFGWIAILVGVIAWGFGEMDI